MQNITKSMTMVLITGSLLLTGCGGGGGGGSSANNNFQATNTVNRFQAVANAVPVEGSVIQYARAKDIANIGITAAGSGAITFDNVIAGLPTVTLSPNDAINSPITETAGSIRVTGREYRKALPNNETLAAEIATLSIGSEHLSVGAWIENYSINSILGDLGIFVDGGTKFDQNNIAALTGEKTYTGIVVGYYYDNEFGDNEPLVWQGDITITVDFGNGTETGTITTAITNLRTDDIGFEITAGARVDLQSAIIDATKEGGFTTGDTRASASDDSLYSGKWGSQFYYEDANNFPKYIAGTLGGTGTNAAAADGTFIGFFIAD